MMTAQLPRRPILSGAALSIVAVAALLAACDVVTPQASLEAVASAQTAVVGTSSIPESLAPKVAGADPVPTVREFRSEPEAVASPQVSSGVRNVLAGTVRGVVTDSETGRPVVNAQVYLEDTGIGGLSARDGTFELADVPSGTYEFGVVYPGYRAGRQSALVVVDGGTVGVTHGLRPAVVAVTGLLIEPSGVALQPAANRPSMQGGAIRNPSGGPTFVPSITLPEISNWTEVGNRIRADANVAGQLLIWAWIDEEGRLMDARIFQSSGSDRLDQVTETVMRDAARFTAALNRDERVPVWVQIPVTVEL